MLSSTETDPLMYVSLGISWTFQDNYLPNQLWMADTTWY